jgi:hypothetical protein
MKNSISILIVFLLVTSGLQSADTNSTKFLPLKIGNVWTYVRTGGWPPNNPPVYFKSVVQRDSVFAGHKYYYLTRIEYLSPANGQDGWFRIDSAKGVLIRFGVGLCSQTSYENIDSISSQVNDLSLICLNDTLHKRRLNMVTSNVRWGVWCLDKSFNWNGGPAGRVRQYSQYFGLSFSGYGETNPLVYNLRGCIIDGVLYGDTNTFLGINQIGNEVPEEFSLSQNYPNPFNPTTRFGFRIADFGLVRLTLFDVLGKEVSVLVNQQLSPGTYEVDFDGTNLPSGVYYYRLDASASLGITYTETRKMVLIR